MGAQPLRVGVLGAAGLVGGELLELLGNRRFPVGELRAFGSGASLGESIELLGEDATVEAADARRVLGCELLFCAARGALEPLWPALRESPARVIDLSGSLELDPSVPLYLEGEAAPWLEREVRWLAIPRGPTAGLALALAPLARAVPLERVSAVTLEPASGVGRAGAEELSVQTIALLNEMSGDPPSSEIFPQPLAFDCLPLVGELQDDGESSEEARLRQVLRRLLGQPTLRVESTRVRVPIFSASLACVHARFAGELSPAQARELWLASSAPLQLLESGELPTPRRALQSSAVLLGRVRGAGTSLAFSVALDDLRCGAALAAVRAAEDWFGLGDRG